MGEARPDLVALQETKVEDGSYPFAEFEELGYTSTVHGQKTYNGVAFLAREPIEDVSRGFGDKDWPEDCRIIRARVRGVTVVNTYVPNGTAVGGEKWDYKLRWLERFRRYCDELASTGDKVVWLGDINIAPTADDVFESEKKFGDVGHHPEEFARWGEIVDWGWNDCFRELTAGPGHHTFWDFRIPGSLVRGLGWRIDHIYASDGLKGQLMRCWCDEHVRTREKPSDHAPVLAEFSGW